ncbi:MAG: sugar ABC transporter ATP-binding protein [Anaerolineaceae bacterium]
MQNEVLLELKDVCKHFPGVQALDSIDFKVHAGEVVSLIGTNGAGKSTMCNIVAGIYAMDKGEIFIKGEPVKISSPIDAAKNKIAIVHQEPSLIPRLSVSENMFLECEIVQKDGIRLDRKAMNNKCHEILDSLGYEIDITRKARTLTVVEQEIVAISRALLKNPQLLIFDEVTAPLNWFEVEHVFNIIRKLADRGVGIIFISHKINETIKIADRVVVFRDGKKVADMPVTEKTQETDIISPMLGNIITEDIQAVVKDSEYIACENKEIVMDVRSISLSRYFHDLSFKLYKGEILGFAGLKGAGITEMFFCLQGGLQYEKGEIYIKGEEKSVRFESPKEGIKAGIGMMTNDRHREGLASTLNVKENIVICSLDRFKRFLGVIDEKESTLAANNMVQKLSIKTPNVYYPLSNLSGGNQQKVVISKWLLRDLDILIIDEPVHGVDVKSKSEIFKLLLKQKDDGYSILVYSPEIRELLNICDRIIIANEGGFVGEVKRTQPNFNEPYILEVIHSSESKVINN